MAHYIIRRGTHENHSGGISSISWLDWDFFYDDRVKEAKPCFNELSAKEGVSWQLVRVEEIEDRFKTSTQEFVEEEINPCGMAEVEKTSWLFVIQKDVLMDDRIVPQVLGTFPSQFAAQKHLLELLRTDETSAGWYSIRRAEMDDKVVAQYKKEGARV